MLQKDFVPHKPFPDYKWRWASYQCTEGINDPVVLLGVLFRMRKLEPLGFKYSSKEFADELADLSKDIKESVGVNLAGRTGSRNLIRNSGQYWRSVGLITSGSRSGKISLTELGRKVADHEISQSEFAAITVQTFKLPNPRIQNEVECKKWEQSGLTIYPLRLLLSVILALYDKTKSEGYITPKEMMKIIVPLSASKVSTEDYANFILWYRHGEVSLAGWPICTAKENDSRFEREYLLFLSYYGYLNIISGGKNEDEQYQLNDVIIDEIREIIRIEADDNSVSKTLAMIRNTEIVSEVERKRVQSYRSSRPNQASFRKAVLNACKRCVITNVTMPEVLEAAHIKPFKYKGEDTVANGFAMRTDIHILFDSGHLRISEMGEVQLSNIARMDYGATIPPRIVIPDFTNREFLRWRWDNYNGI